MIPGCLILVLIFIIWLRYELKKSSHNEDAFWETEAKANKTRKKPLDSLYYITIPTDSLPFFYDFDKKLDKIQEKILELSSKKIVNLSGITNTQLKLEYGAANLDTLTEYDENFTELTRTLYEWATCLRDLDKLDAAITVLEYGITNCHIDTYNHYMLLGKLYVANGQHNKLPELINSADSLDCLMHDSIIRDLTMLSDYTV